MLGPSRHTKKLANLIKRAAEAIRRVESINPEHRRIPLPYSTLVLLQVIAQLVIGAMGDVGAQEGSSGWCLVPFDTIIDGFTPKEDVTWGNYR